MILHPKASRHFLSNYSVLLGQVHLLTEGEKEIEMMKMLHKSRVAIVNNPSLVEAAALSLESRGHSVAEDVVEAIQSLRVRKWIYLRDTTRYSIFIDPDGKDAYGVLGLTEPLRDIVGGTGLVIETGLVRFRDAYACDGIMANPIWLGANYKRDYADLFKSLKASGHFHV
ncbi:MAG: hypothetical protein JWL77_1285 [Chthonomonadaceae bacterium]|nr:hypothetical protein [Chthonomonadaceae bacterium]